MKKLLISLTLSVLAILPSYAQMSDSKVPLPTDIAAIKKAGKLVVAMNGKDSPPFFSGKDDNLHGLDVDIARSVGKQLGVPVEFRRDADSFDEVAEQVRDGRADIAISKLSITGPRLQALRFSAPYVTLKQSIIINRLWLSQNTKGREPYEVIRDFDGKISFIRNSSYDTYARINFPKATFLPEDDWDIVIANVTSGKINAAYRDEFEIKKISFEKPEAALTTKTITISDSVDQIGVAVRPTSLQLLGIANFVISSEYNNIDTKRLMNRYKENK
jgi:ABC-type amino acid transport substrate-binding protein